MFDIESYLTKLMGDFSKKFSPIKNSNLSKISYSKNLFRYPTIQMVIISPLLIHNYTNEYILNENSQFNFLLYDTETDLTKIGMKNYHSAYMMQKINCQNMFVLRVSFGSFKEQTNLDINF